MSTHTGVGLRIDINGQTVLEGDSDWLHMAAVFAMGAPVQASPAVMDAGPREYPWHEIAELLCPPGAMSRVQIYVKPVHLPDSYPDDEPWDGT